MPGNTTTELNEDLALVRLQNYTQAEADHLSESAYNSLKMLVPGIKGVQMAFIGDTPIGLGTFLVSEAHGCKHVPRTYVMRRRSTGPDDWVITRLPNVKD